MPFQDLIHVSAEYSNAVLVAVLPYISDYAAKLELPVPIPVEPAHVRRFVTRDVSYDVGGYLTLTNDFQFWFDWGHVDTFQAPGDYFMIEDPRDLPKYFGKLNMNQNEALKLVREAVRRLGYSEKILTMDRQPKVRGPVRYGTNLVPFFVFNWEPAGEGSTHVEAHVDAERSRLVHLWLVSTNLHRAAPKVAVTPMSESEWRRRNQTNRMTLGTNAPATAPSSQKKIPEPERLRR